MSIKQNGGVFGRNPTFNDVTIEGDLIINGEVFTGLDFQGSWNASTNSPTLASSVGTNGEFYIVSIAGTTDLNGITNWGIGDWAIFNGTAWQRVEGGADGNFNALTANSLTVNGSGGRNYLNTSHTRVTDGYNLEWGGGTNYIRGSNASNYIAVTTNGTERMRIDSSGNVGIGESDPSGFWAQANQLVIEDANCGLTLKSAVSGNGRLVFTDTKSTTAGLNDGGMISYSHADDAMIVQTSGDEAMRIDSIGNVLVGKTTSDLGATAGIELNGQYDVGYFTRSGEKALVANRLVSDGDIMSFRKDGTTVGSIGAGNTRLYAGSYDTGISFAYDVDTIRPYNTTTGADRDNAINLGSSGARFKDIHLSGGVYLGGTGAANLLDDYESGTFNVTVNGDATGVIGVQTGNYVKVGKVVHIDCAFTVTTNFTASSVGGLPFTPSIATTASSLRPFSLMVNNAQDVSARIANGATTIGFGEVSNGTAHEPDTSSSAYRITGSYFVA